MKDTCRFCAISEDRGSFGAADTKLAENRDYFAIPSIGSLVEGWVLVVPQQHRISLRNSYDSEGFREFVADIADSIAAAYGNVVAFEHGPNTEGSVTGCGTDHAHLHLVPTSLLRVHDLHRSTDIAFTEVNIGDIREVVGENEYLAFFPDIANRPTRALVAILDAPVSQYFRRLLAEKLGLTPDAADYRKETRLGVAEATVASLQQRLEDVGAHATT